MLLVRLSTDAENRLKGRSPRSNKGFLALLEGCFLSSRLEIEQVGMEVYGVTTCISNPFD